MRTPRSPRRCGPARTCEASTNNRPRSASRRAPCAPSDSRPSPRSAITEPLGRTAQRYFRRTTGGSSCRCRSSMDFVVKAAWRNRPHCNTRSTSDGATFASRPSVEVRTALLDLASAREAVAATRERVQLAEQEVSQASERFRAGVAGNADVFTASISLNGGAHASRRRARRLPDFPDCPRPRAGQRPGDPLTSA